MQDNKKTTETVVFRMRTTDGITEVFPQRFFGIVTIICLAGALGLVLFAPPNATGFDLAERVYFLIFMFLLATPLLLFSFVVRYYLDSEKIVFRSMLGNKKTLQWKDIKSVKVGMNPTKIKLYSDKIKIKIYPAQHFGAGSLYLKDMVRSHCPDAEWK